MYFCVSYSTCNSPSIMELIYILYYSISPVIDAKVHNSFKVIVSVALVTHRQTEPIKQIRRN